jgi:uncharacterized protein
MITTDFEISVHAEALTLLPERAIFWPRRSTLFVADVHCGKAATLRAAAIPIPSGTTTADLARLSAIVQRTGAKRVVLLGDTIHSRAGRAPRTLTALAEWRARHARLDILLIRGNHDRMAGDPPAGLDFHCVDAPETEAPFVFQHYPAPSPHGYALAGHTHPAIKLSGIASERITVPCFHFTATHATLPAFGSMTGNALIHPSPGDRVYGVADGDVVQIL